MVLTGWERDWVFILLGGSHEALGAEFLHRVATDVVLGATGAFAGLGQLKFFDDLVDVAGWAIDRVRDGMAAE